MSTVEPQGAHSPQREGTHDGGVAAAVSLAAGAIVTLGGLSRRRTLPGLIMTGIGGALLLRGASGRGGLPLLGARDDRSADEIEEEVDERGIEVSQAFLVGCRPEELYAYWRDFRNLPRIMTYVQDVLVKDDRHSRWVAKAPLLAGGSVEWDAEVTRDQRDRAIAWRSLPGSDVDTVGEIRFEPALGDRGTEVHVRLSYLPPAGRAGHWLAKVFGKAPRRTIREDLRTFKRIMEVGESPTTTGQSRGTCLKSSKRTEQ